ncbi:MAG: carboxynorspermidine decarboxylase [Muribaculaceae bacterium]|nr:carboxynorspermidine decarboxylase [Muribaculaceae bacterium]
MTVTSESEITTPYYIVYEDKIRANMRKLKDVEQRAGVKLIMAFKAYALWKTFPIIGEYFTSSTASSLNEMKLSLQHLGNDVHAYCPVYTDETFPQFLNGCTHITFNSLTQFERFYPLIVQHNASLSSEQPKVSAGLRINPRCSVVDTDIYNPMLPGSRFGVEAKDLTRLPDGLDGLHFHALCESDSYDLEKVLEAIEEKFGQHLKKIKWLNMGGGHLITRKDYDTDHLVKILTDFKSRYPNLDIIMEPGSAFTWQTGDLVTQVLDVVENSGIRTAIIDASFACHMPDCLEMPYQPKIAEAIPEGTSDGIPYRLGGNSCLSGDYVGDWFFSNELKSGDRLRLMDMNHYTTVKTTMFNGIQHPSIWLAQSDGEIKLLREYTYDDYKSRMD